MTTLNRRSLISSVAASVAVMALPKSILAAQPSRDESTFESAMTGTVIEILDTEWYFSVDSYEISNQAGARREYLSLIHLDLKATGQVEFIEMDGTADEHLDRLLAKKESQLDQFEVVATGETDTGVWAAGAITWREFKQSFYCEFQPDAFDGVGLGLTMTARPETFLDALNSFQEGVLIGDLEPMTMMAESKIASLDIPVLTPITTTTDAGNSNSSTSNTNSNTNTSSRTRTNTASTETPVADSSSFVDVVIGHRNQFFADFETFAAGLGVFADSTATDAQKDGAFDDITAAAQAFTTYPAEAAKHTAPAEYADLGKIYSRWAVAIGTLGETWMDIMAQQEQIATLFDRIDDVDKVDRELAAALGAL